MDAQSDVKGARGAGSLVAKVSGALRAAIAAGEFGAGDKLPSEAQLTALHGVSRTVVREAIAALRADGLVEARQGAGIFVREPTPGPGLSFRNIDTARVSSILEILELRAPVEIEAAGLAALRRSPAQEETIVERHRDVQACMERGEPTADADFALHSAIAAATNNPRFKDFLEMMGRAAIPRAALQAGAKEESPSAYLQQIHEEHAAIVAAISDGEPDAAREAMRRHLKGSERRYRALLQSLR